MFWSKVFIPTLKETPQEAESVSHQLLLRAGLIRQLMAGVYSYLPLGLKVLNNIEEIIRQELNSCGASELLLPALQPLDLWIKSGRDKDMGDVMIRFVDRKGRNVCLGPTHEEAITDLVKNYILSYRDLPLVLYQIQTKFRDEIRPRFALVRACEFIMKDAYSFDKDQQGLDKNYKAMYNAYKRIFKRCGLKILTVEADPGVMGGNMSHEFMAPTEDGEDLVLSCHRCKFTQAFSRQEGGIPPKAGKEGKQDKCPKCNTELEKISCIEVGHVFQLGTKYSLTLEVNFVDSDGKIKPVIMGCYGIGVSRLISAIIEQNRDASGIVWPDEISPFEVIVLPLDVTDRKTMKLALDIYKELEKNNIEALFDDRDERAGVKFKDADLLGFTMQVIIGKESLKKNTVELKMRRSHKKMVETRSAILKEIKRMVNG